MDCRGNAAHGCTIAIGYLLFISDFPGGMRPSYPAVDGDPRLTEVARTALPFIAALRRYYEQHGDYPSRVEVMRPFLRATIDETGQSIDGWRYSPTTEPAGFAVLGR